MKKVGGILLLAAIIASFGLTTDDTSYKEACLRQATVLTSSLQQLRVDINKHPTPEIVPDAALKQRIFEARLALKKADFWLRYLEPISYKKINGPLAVEWENEVFEKYEHPYRREGAGLSLAELYLNEEHVYKDTLLRLITPAIEALNVYRADSIVNQLTQPGNLQLCNRLFLLNLAAIYTNGFECPAESRIIPELRYMMHSVRDIYTAGNRSFPGTAIPEGYLSLYNKALVFVDGQSADYKLFDHFTFIKDYINPLFTINQQLLTEYRIISRNYNDYSLNNTANSIFDKQLYTAQNTKGIYSLMEDAHALGELKTLGKSLFYDPILSGNNQRACASCHKPEQYFTDTATATAMAFDGQHHLPRNTPSLINVIYSHLLMLDGRHISLHAQGKDVMTTGTEMGSIDTNLLQKVLSCKEYRQGFKHLLKYTPEEKEITLEHIVSAITYYYGGFSNYYSPFDDAMNHNTALNKDAVRGFNLFMSKAKCGTCHYVPQFSGVPPPYISSEFEVVGTPADTAYASLSTDRGRYAVNPAPELDHAFRVTTVRNAAHTKPYMHNGVFKTLEQLIAFYEEGGGAGKKLNVPNQTLAHDKLKLTPGERKDLIAFIHSLDEHILFDTPPERLPSSASSPLNNRKVGGDY